MQREGWAKILAALGLSAISLTNQGCARRTSPGPTYPYPYAYAPYGAPYGPPVPYGSPPAPYGAPPAQGYAAPYPGPPAAPGPYTRPASPAAAAPQGALAAIAFARAQLGRPYCWGGNGPECFDCSGLTHAAWLAGGKAIPRTSSAQSEKLTPVPIEAVRPGDIVWRPGHVGLYVGEGLAIHAPESGDVVRYQEVSRYKKAFRP